MTNFAIRTGCKLTIEKAYFTGSWKKPKFDGSAILKIEILRHSYGAEKGQHTFTCKVLEVVSSESSQAHSQGDEFRIKGRNLYPNVLEHIQGKESVRDSIFA